MNIKLGIVGLPNVGKSTFFNTALGMQKASAENFPFCTIDPNIGTVIVSDTRLDQLAKISKPENIIHSAVELVDIAGLVKGANEGEGLGNKFLSHIRECHAICHLLRFFENKDIHHVYDRIHPGEDFDIIITELILADIQSIDKQLDRQKKQNNKERVVLLEKIKDCLLSNQMAQILEFNDTEKELVQEFHLLTMKPFMIVVNVDEAGYEKISACSPETWQQDFLETFPENFHKLLKSIPIIPMCIGLESQMNGLTPDEVTELLADVGIVNTGFNNVIRQGFDLLNLQNYFTAGDKEVRSWTIPKNTTAPQAAGVIHTDFEKGFICAEVIAYEDFISHEGFQGSKESGKLRVEGKDYLVKDGDVMVFKTR